MEDLRFSLMSVLCCSRCGLRICNQCVKNKPEQVSLHLLRCDVVALLETQSVDSIRQAVTRLQVHYDPQGVQVDVDFDGCANDILNGDPGIAKANGKRIVVCDTARAKHFQREPSIEVPNYEEQYHVKHLTVVILHEFGHVLDRRGKLPKDDDSFLSDDKEARANAFVHHFLSQ